MINGKRLWHYRWFVLGVCFLGVNMYGVFRKTPAQPSEPAGVRFEAGVDGLVSNDVPLVWRFATDMVQTNQIGEFRSTGLFTLSPEVGGRWIWDDARTLRFLPDAPWPVGNRFRATHVRPLFDLAGQAVPLPPPPEIRTTPFQLISVHQINRERQGSITLQAEFNQVPDRTQLTQFVTIGDSDGDAIPYRLLGESASTNVYLRIDRSTAGPLRFLVRKGLRAESGPEGLPADDDRTVPLTVDMVLLGAGPDSAAFASGQIRLNFSLRPDLARLPSFISVDPPVDHVIEPRGSGCRLIGAFLPDQTYTVRLRAGLASIAGPTLAEDQRRVVYFPNRPSAVSLPGRGHYLSAAGSRQVEIKSTNIERMELSAERIYPNNLVQFAMRREGNYSHWYGSAYANDRISRLTGKLSVAGAGVNNLVVTNRFDLTPLMGDHAAGAYYLTVSSEGGRQDRRLVVISDIGIAVKHASPGLVLWVNSLQTLRPITGATVRVFSQANQEIGQGRTDGDGLLELAHTAEEAPFLVTVEAGDDINYLCLQSTAVPMSGDTGGRAYLTEGYEACVFTDRGIYRPGETSRVHAVVRDCHLETPAPFPVVLEVLQPDGRVFQRRTATLDSLGTAGFDVALPEYVPTGRYTIQLMIPGQDQALGFTRVAVEDFVPPTIAVDLDTPGERLRGGDELAFDVVARHLFGAPAAGQPAVGRLITRAVAFDPPGWPGYRFGDGEKPFRQPDVALGKQVLDDDGRSSFHWTVPDGWRPPGAVSLLLVGTVTDSGGRTVSAFGSRLVDAYPVYLGIHLPSDQHYWSLKEAIQVEVAAVEPGGGAVQPAGPIRMTLQRIDWVTAMREENGQWKYESTRHLTSVREQELPFQGGRSTLTLTLDEPGSYLLTIADPETGASSSVTLDGYSRDAYAGAWSMEKPDQVELKLDRDGYPAGDVARLSIKAPFAGKALLTIESDRVLSRQILELTANSHQVEIPVLPEYLPNVYCSLTLLRPVVAEEVWSPHRAVGVVQMVVSDPAEQLAVTLQAPEVIRPQGRLRVNLAVTDQAGAGVAAQVVLAAVDEGICRLTDFQTPDPLGYFRAQRALAVKLSDLYGLLMPELAEEVTGTPSSPGGDMMGLVRGRLNPIRARRFKPTALWSGPVMTGPDGTATIELDVPEFTGELRLMVVGIGSNAFGRATAKITVKRPLVVQSSLPRFLAPGDRCTLPVRLFNETGADAEARVEVTCDGPVRVSPTAPTELALPEGRNQAVDFELQATGDAGTATVIIRVVGGGETYQESFELAVRPAAPRVTHTAVGTVGPGETVRLSQPGNWIGGTGRRQLWCAGVPTLRLAGGLDYLLRYPYGCVEQTTSSAFPLLYLADLAEWLQPGSITRDDVAGYVDSAILQLWSMQHRDGSFGYWGYSSDTYSWGSLYATHFLVEALRAGYQVDRDRLAAALGYLQALLNNSSPVQTTEVGEAWRIDRNLRAYACQVLALAGHPQPNWTARLQEEAHLLSTTARCHLAASLALAGHRADAGALLGELRPAATDAPPGGRNPTRESPARELALRLAGWLLVDPHHPEVAILARRLDAMGGDGHWRTTQDNAMVLLALGQYSRHLQDQQVGFTATATWAGGTETRSISQETPLQLAPGDDDTVVLTNQGPGPLYFYDTNSGVPVDGIIAPVDQDLLVRRTLLGRDGAPLASSRIAQGELVIVQLEVSAGGATLDDVVIEDLLPAGLEIENPHLTSSEQLPGIKKLQSLPVRHADARDDRMLVFTGAFSGTRYYHYAARAVTPGTYVLPPVGAEAMYEPAIRSVHGRGTLEVTR